MRELKTLGVNFAVPARNVYLTSQAGLALPGTAPSQMPGPA